MSAPESLLDLLEARDGIVCAVGAGGKKSVLQHLAARHPARVAQTATVVTTHFPEELGFAVAIDEGGQLPARVAALGTTSKVAYACPSDKPGRHAGVAAHVIERIHLQQGFAATYVKADGANTIIVLYKPKLYTMKYLQTVFGITSGAQIRIQPTLLRPWISKFD